MPVTVTHSCPETFYDDFERKGAQTWTTHYCPGCGHGNLHKYIAEAIDDFGIQDKTVFVSPVGCSVFGYYYLDVGNVQVPHGRSPAAATGLKRADPDSVVLGYQGDGDLAAIGGNEILHAANRGENITVFFVNNAIYGMTGGQMAPTSLMGMETTTSPQGRSTAEGFPVRICELLSTLDAPFYIERVAIGDPKHNGKARKAVRKAIKNQIENRGFSLVEVLSPCPTGWKRDPVDAAKWSLEVLTQTFPLGVYRDGHELDLGHPRHRNDPPESEIPALLEIGEDERSLDLPEPAPIDDMLLKIAGFGGQGVLLAGIILARAGMIERRQVSWMPSYGPEMRGGTAHCNVTLSDHEIGSPLVDAPTVLIAMNGPSMERFAPTVVPGGTVIYNASMIESAPDRDDIAAIAVPANKIAEELGSPKVANMVVLGALLEHAPVVSRQALLDALKLALKGNTDLFDLNHKAIDAGAEVVKAVVAG